MEKKFYTEHDNFEQFLKETTDSFRMYPSKRVWHSIYNDLHPGRRWPSLAVWLLLISSVTFIGLSNRNKITTGAGNGNKTISSTNLLENTGVFTELYNGSPEKNAGNNNLPIQHGSNSTISNVRNNPILNDLADNNSTQTQIVHTGLVNINSTETVSRDLIAALPADNSTDNGSNAFARSVTKDGADPVLNKTITNSSTVNNEPDIALTTNIALATVKVKEADKKKTVVPEKLSPAFDKAWMEDYALHNKPSTSKWKTRVTYQLYATPSIGYRVLDKTANYDFSNTSLVASNSTPRDVNNTINQVYAFNMEAGAGILYRFSKIIRFKAGLQFNYTSYTINANELRHPTLTTLLIKDINNDYPELVSRSATLSNTPGVSPKKINNTTYQVSLPIGADVKLAGQNNRLQWFAGVTIQPTFVTGGNAYLLSADLKNYVSDESFTRKWNLNAGIETFLSYKTKGGVTLNAGPQLRYQLLSTYDKQYTFSEKLYNLGLKIGITTNF